MNNIIVSLKKIITNKNTVTFVGVIVILGLLYWGYNSTIESQVQPVRIPVATETIQPRTLITDDLVTYIEVPSISVSSNVIRNSTLVVGKYTDINTVVPEGSMFYNDVLIDKEDLPDSAFTAVKDGERPYSLDVTVASTYGNSIFPGNKIDVYMKAVDENGLVMIGRLLAKVDVLAVKDSSGNNVFEDTSTERTPATLLFGVPEENYKIDLTIARGLDYYTGTVYETFLNNYREVGSVCSGGRYENLAEYYTDKRLPGVGISIGLTRLFYQLNEIKLIQASKKSIADILIISMTKDFEYVAKLANKFRNEGKKVQIYFEDKKVKAQFKYADKLQIPYTVVIGEDEVNSNTYTIKNMETGEQETVSI